MHGARSGWCRGSRSAVLTVFNDLEAREASEQFFRDKPLWQAVLVSAGALRRNVLTDPPIKSEDGGELDLIQCVIGPQGPNYLLAKRIQHWRAIKARFVDGITVSSNV